MYRNSTTETLSCVELNHDMILCDKPCCASQTHRNAINRMYTDITDALKKVNENLICVNHTPEHDQFKIGMIIVRLHMSKTESLI